MDDVDDLELSADENLPPRKRRAFLFGRHSFSAALLKQPDPIEKLDASQGKNCSQNGQVSSPHARLGTNLDVQTALDELQPVERSHPQGVHSRQVVLSHQRDETIGGSQMLPLNRGGNNHTAIKKEAGCLEGSHNLALVSNSAIEEQEQGCNDAGVRETIPGPAGRLQRALQKKAQYAPACEDRTHVEDEDSSARLDVDFLSNAWTLGSQAASQGLETLANALSGVTHGRIQKIVLFVSDLRPNGEKATYTKLKDPTGSIGAILHHTTLRAHPEIDIGTVLLLEKVAVFAPDDCTNYLCIMPENVTEITSETSGNVHSTLQGMRSILCSTSTPHNYQGDSGQMHQSAVLTQKGFPSLSNHTHPSHPHLRPSQGCLYLDQTHQSRHVRDSNLPGSIGSILKAAAADGLETHFSRSTPILQQDCVGDRSLLSEIQPSTSIQHAPNSCIISSAKNVEKNETLERNSSHGSLPMRNDAFNEGRAHASTKGGAIPGHGNQDCVQIPSNSLQRNGTVMDLFLEARNSHGSRTSL